MEKQKNTAAVIRHILTVCLVAVMLVTGLLAAYRGADYAMRYISEAYGYLLTDTDVEAAMMTAATEILENVKKYPADVWESQEICSYVLTDTGRYDDNGTVYKSGKEEGISKDIFFADKTIGFMYDGETAYMKYSDGTVREYADAQQLKALDEAMVMPYDTGIRLYMWVDEDYYDMMNPGAIWLKTLPEYTLKNIVQLMVAAGCSLMAAAAVSARTRRELQSGHRIFTELPIAVGAVVCFGAMLLTTFFDDRSDIKEYNNGVKALIVAAIGVMLLAAYWGLRELKLKLQEQSFWKDFFVIRFICGIGRLLFRKSNYKDFSLTKKLWIRRLLYLAVNVLYTLVLLMPRDIYLFCMGTPVYLILFVVYMVYEMRLLRSLNAVYQQVDAMYRGEYGVREADAKDLTCDITEKLNGLSNGLEEAIEKRISSEKMKVELITNVSHDLKTPLTSIVSYVNLLKEEEMSEVAASYVKILEDKSNQLKALVADVFDLAKANSGQDVEIENIDGIMLIRQVLADMEDAIGRSGRVIKQNIRPETFSVRGDGKKLYRALQNLIGNALKYSMEGTRIYIQSEVREKRLHITMKNISACEMEFTGEEIVERFVRGDESRTTEGSGLGLAIAKSFIEASGGTMKVEVDGDVFKVEVELGNE